MHPHTKTLLAVLLFIVVQSWGVSRQKLHELKNRVDVIHQHAQTLERHLRIPLLQEGLLQQPVHEFLKQRLPSGCSYELIREHPGSVVTNGDAVIVHVINAKRWATNSAHPHCTAPTHSIFLKSLHPNSCYSAVDFEWVECGGGLRDAGGSPIQPKPWKGQTYVFFCRESPKQQKPPAPHWIDGGSGLCAVFPTNWVPPLTYFLELQPVPLEEKKKHVLITSAISHSYTRLRAELTQALIRRRVSFHRFGKVQRSISMEAYLRSFNSSPHILPEQLAAGNWRAQKENAIRWSKFHLALEHSSQNGYMSEKVWQALRVGSVPIYYGAPEARFFLPPHSTIFLRDYPSYDALIDYLLYLDRNDSAYLEYLQWRQQLQQPRHPYTAFLSSYGQGELLSEHFCLVDAVGSSVLEQNLSVVQPFRSVWTDWISGQQCEIPEGGCAKRADFRDPPFTFHCPGISLQPYNFPDKILKN